MNRIQAANEIFDRANGSWTQELLGEWRRCVRPLLAARKEELRAQGKRVSDRDFEDYLRIVRPSRIKESEQETQE